MIRINVMRDDVLHRVNAVTFLSYARVVNKPLIFAVDIC